MNRPDFGLLAEPELPRFVEPRSESKIIPPHVKNVITVSWKVRNMVSMEHLMKCCSQHGCRGLPPFERRSVLRQPLRQTPLNPASSLCSKNVVSAFGRSAEDQESHASPHKHRGKDGRHDWTRTSDLYRVNLPPRGNRTAWIDHRSDRSPRVLHRQLGKSHLSSGLNDFVWAGCVLSSRARRSSWPRRLNMEFTTSIEHHP